MSQGEDHGDDIGPGRVEEMATKALAALGGQSRSGWDEVRGQLLIRLARIIDTDSEVTGAMIKEFRSLMLELEGARDDADQPARAGATGKADEGGTDWSDLGTPG